jgi:DNA modification methylase
MPNSGRRDKQSELGKRTYTGFNERWRARAGGGNFSKVYADQQPAHGGESLRKPYETRNKRSVWTVSTKAFRGAHFATFPPKLIEPMILAGCPVGGVVLDMFFGAGTTGYVAQRNARNWIGCDLNPEYVRLAQKRLSAPYQLTSMFTYAEMQQAAQPE